MAKRLCSGFFSGINSCVIFVRSVPLFPPAPNESSRRYLKYTPEHMHCFCYFYGPIIPQNTGIMAFQSMGNTSTGESHRPGSPWVINDLSAACFFWGGCVCK